MNIVCYIKNVIYKSALMQARLESYEHEKKHIEHNDFHRCANVRDMEREAG